MSSDHTSRPHGMERGAIVFALFAIAGCGTPQGEIFPQLDPPLVWPAPPETPRIQYVGELIRNTDLKWRRSLGESLADAVFGGGESFSMLTPQGVCTDDRGRVFIADGAGQMIHVFDIDARRYDRWVPRPEQSSFAQPVAVAVGPRQELFVSDAVGGAIHVFDASGKWLRLIGEETLERPAGIAIDAVSSRLVVVDAGAHMVRFFDFNGELLQSFGSRGVGPSQFNFPTHVAIDDNGNLYVSDSLNFRVQVFDSSLEPLRIIGSQGDLPGYFAQPKGIAVDSDGHIYVVDAQFEAVQVFDNEGRLLIAFGHEGTEHGEFWLPNGIFIDSTDRIWVADTYNRRIQVFEYLGEARP